MNLVVSSLATAVICTTFSLLVRRLKASRFNSELALSLIVVTFLAALFSLGKILLGYEYPEFSMRVFFQSDLLVAVCSQLMLFSYVILYKFISLKSKSNFILSFSSFKSLFLAPFVEELIFRLFLYKVLCENRRTREITYVLQSSFWFAICHQQTPRLTLNTSMLVPLMFGVYSSAVFVKSRNILACILLHTFANFMGPPLPLSESFSRMQKILLRATFILGILGCLAVLLSHEWEGIHA